MMSEAIKLSNLLLRLENKFNVTEDGVHMLRIVKDEWDAHEPVRVTDILKKFTRTSRATTHHTLRELVSARLLREETTPDDKRVKYLVPGPKFAKYEEEIKKVMA